MPSNPLQDNGLPKYNWFERICTIIILAERRGEIELSAKTPGGQGGFSFQGWVKKIVRREIVRVAKDFVGRIKWGTQAGQHERRNLELVIESRQRIINGLREQLREARKDAGK